MLASFFQQMHMNAPKSMNQYMIVAKLFSGILRKCDVARHPLVIPVSLDCSKQLCPSENDNKEMFKTGCRGVMERDQSCYSVRINQRSQQTVNTHTQHQSVPLLYWDVVCLYLFTAPCVRLCSQQLSAQFTEIYCWLLPIV